jgi:DNA-binding MarR family transcriptional regulator
MNKISRRLAEIFPVVMGEFYRMDAGYAAGLELPMVQFKTLMVVANDSLCSLSEVSRSLNITPGWASETVEKLVRLGMLERRVSPRDRRRIELDVTEKGDRFIREYENGMKEYWKNVLKIIQERETREKLLEGIELLHEVALELKSKRKKRNRR